jgi:hypothetical protein
MKSYTDLEQSKKLAEILPLETADMRYDEYISYIDGTPKVGYKKGVTDGIPCWSLAALLDILPADKIITMGITIEDNKKIFSVGYMDKQRMYQAEKENMVDACVDVILKLHELKML